MPIHDLSYRHWQGERSNLPPAWVLGWTQLRLALRRRAVRILLLVSGLFVVAYMLLLYVETMPRDGPLGFLSQLPVVKLNGDTLQFFLMRQRLLHYLLCLAAGAEVIALDRRYKALQIYLARPLRVHDYLLGKGLPLILLLSLSSWVPALLLLILKSIATASLQWLRDEPFLPLAILGYGMCLTSMLTSVTLAVSSLSSSPRLASGQLVALLLLTVAIAEILSGLTGNEAWRLLSMDANLDQLCRWFFRANLPYETSPWSSLGVVLTVILGGAVLLQRRVRAVDIVGGT